MSKMTQELKALSREIESYKSDRITSEADRLDIEIPTDPSVWEVETLTDDDLIPIRRLTQSGRSALRRLIDEEKMRRREVKAWWWKTILLPAITALSGFAGMITGSIAVIHAKK